MTQKPLAASANIGVGLWTSICVAFCSLLGKQSKNYKKKQTRLLAMANEELVRSFKDLGKGYSLSDYKVTWFGRLFVTVSALATKDSNPDGEEQNSDESVNSVCPKCGEPIDDGMLFCGACGQRLK